MNRFFKTDLQGNVNAKANENTIVIDGDEGYHAAKVLRLNIDEKIIVCDGNGVDYLCRVSEINKNTVVSEFVEKLKNQAEPSVKVTLFQGLTKGDKMDYIILKAVELGVTKVVPVMTHRCVSKVTPGSKDAEAKVLRWKKIAHEAAKQSGRGIIPEIGEVVSFKDALQLMKTNEYGFMLYEGCAESKADNKMEDIAKKRYNTISFMTGPEGGFEISETECAKSIGIDTFTLGKRILRTETASLCAISVLMYITGNC